MTKIVLDVPDEFTGLVEIWRETLDSLQSTRDRTGGGKVVDYAEIERETSKRPFIPSVTARCRMGT